MRILITTISILFLFNTFLYGQAREITLDNPSFEGTASPGANIRGWIDCGLENFPKESPPDLQPGFFDVDISNKGVDGNTFLGLVYRDNDTWESVSQTFSSPLEAGVCYSFSLYLSKNINYISPARNSGVLYETAKNREEELIFINHNSPCLVRVWGSKRKCKDVDPDLLAESSLISHERWIRYDFKLKPSTTSYYLTLEVFMKTPSFLPINGHILIDNLSSIKPVPCVTPDPIVDFLKPDQKKITVSKSDFFLTAALENIYEKEKLEFSMNDRAVSKFAFDEKSGRFSANIRLKKGENRIRLSGSNEKGSDEDEVFIVYQPEEEMVSNPTVPNVSSPAKEKTTSLSGVERTEMKEEQKLEIKNLEFLADSSSIQAKYFPILDKIYNFLDSNRDVVIEIGGHTNDRCNEPFCTRLSEKRAKSVSDYLVVRGISQSQLQYKGYGKSEPLISNRTEGGRKKNQRVEIKILSLE